MSIHFLLLTSFVYLQIEAPTPEDVVTTLFISTDQQDWEVVKGQFGEKVFLDYASMSGVPGTTLSPEEIVSSWKGVLPGFAFTHHQIGNVQTHIEQDQAQVLCYGTATHFLPDPEGNIWTVVGSYHFDLARDASGFWKITSMKFNFKYQDGNTKLPAKAIEKLK